MPLSLPKPYLSYTLVMDHQQTIHSIRDLFESTCMILFQSFDCKVVELGDIEFDSTDVPTASVDAGSNDLEITLFLQLPFSALAMTYPIQRDVVNVDEGKLEDWICELSNQLIGKFKTELRAHGCHLDSGLPDFTLTSETYENVLQSQESFTFYYDIDNIVFVTSICMELLDDEIVFNAANIVDGNAVDDGDLELF